MLPVYILQHMTPVCFACLVLGKSEKRVCEANIVNEALHYQTQCQASDTVMIQ